MPSADDRLRRLGELVAERRTALGLSYTSAVSTAGMNKRTWQRFEAGERTQDAKYAGVERALHWQEGAIQRFLTGGPEPQDRNLIAVLPAGDGEVDEVYGPAEHTGPPEEYYRLNPDVRAALDTIIRRLPPADPPQM
jgi:transcriptional regulator with XRE-family HTH domain